MYAVNCGGGAHEDVNGIYYIMDPSESANTYLYLTNRTIRRVPFKDYPLYKTVRYVNHSDFNYNISVKGEGHFVLVLKFLEGAISKAGRKFNVVLNKVHTVLKNFDIFVKVAFATAHDEYVPFSLDKGHLIYKGNKSVLNDGKVSIDFVSIKNSTPVISAFYIIRGNIDDVPKLKPIHLWG